MLSKRFIIVALVAIFVASAFLAYLFWEESREPKADYSWLVSEMLLNERAREKGLRGFVLVEPQRVLHIGDPIVVRFGAIYDPLRWEIQEEMFHTLIPLPGKFEVRDRQVYTAKRGGWAIIEAVLLVQCLVCREGVENVSFPMDGFLARDKETGSASAIPLSRSSNGRMKFAPLTDSGYKVDDTLVRLSVYDDHRIRVPFLALAGVCLLIAVGLFLYVVFLVHSRHAEPVEEDLGKNLVLSRVKELRQAFQTQDDAGIIKDTAHSLSGLLLAYRGKHGDADGKVADMLGKLGVVYSEDGILEEAMLHELLGQAERLVAQGEV